MNIQDIIVAACVFGAVYFLGNKLLKKKVSKKYEMIGESGAVSHIKDMIEKAEQAGGDTFYRYNAVTANCQRFISVLKK